jgi:phosphoglucomutase
MTAWMQVYNKWDAFKELDPSIRLELESLKEDHVKLEDSFDQQLEFGTGEICGLIGPGTNRMNIYTVRKAANGLANYLLANQVNVKDRGVVLAYGPRSMSKEFALEAVKVLAFYGIRTYLFESVRPTPSLAFAVRYLRTTAGIMITANDKPEEYNGFKVYNEDGAQMTAEEAERLNFYVNRMEDEFSVPYVEQKELAGKELVYWLKDEIEGAYLERLQYISKMKNEEQLKAKDLQIVLASYHGTALSLVRKGLEQLHFDQVHIVEEQEILEAESSTAISPSPDAYKAFQGAIGLGKKVDAEMLLAIDPDGEKLRVAVRTIEGNYRVLTGNQLGSILLDYILRHCDLNVYRNSRIIKSIVTSELGRAIADSYYVQTIDTLTGFNYIGEKIGTFHSSGETFLFGFEESDNFLVNGFVRDKDAIQTSIMTTEMAYYWKKQGKTLLDVLEDLYQKHGYYLEGTSAFIMENQNDFQKVMDQWRENPPMEFAGLNVKQMEDYEKRERRFVEDTIVEDILLPPKNMMKFHLENNAWVCIISSSIEHKIKYYYGVCSESMEDSKEQLLLLESTVNKRMEDVLKNRRINYVS